jgi:hypothetical protein
MTNKNKKPAPINTVVSKRLCPVCGEPSYSASGIHPQCATVQADAPRSQRLRDEKKAEAEKKAKQPSGQRRSSFKKCPKCRAEVHVRRKQCDCGHDFA